MVHCRDYLRERPDDPDALQFLATALLARGEAEAAVATLRHAVRVNPGHAQMQLTLVRLLLKSGAIDEAITVCEQASAAVALSKTARAETITVLARLGRYDDAERIMREGFSVAPPAGSELHQLSRILFEQGRVDEAISVLRGLVDETGAQPAVHSDMLRAMNYSDAFSPEVISAEHARWNKRHAVALAADAKPHANDRSVDRRLRIGFVSPYFRKHAVMFFLESVVPALCTDFDIFLYADVAQEDEYSARLRSFVALWRDTHTLDDAQLAMLIRADAVDILIDLSGHTPGNRLLAFARRPAPVQMTWNGYPNTTGLQAIDYRVTDAHCDPPGATEHLHSERLLRLPTIFMSWRPPGDAPAVSELPAKYSGRITFASLNSCYKLSPTILAVWAKILVAQPSARLLLATVPPGSAQQRIEQALAAAGVDPKRLVFRPRVDHAAFLRLHAEADIALDPFPYHGTTTTCFSLWMGVPVVSLAGRSHAARVGVTLLTHAGLPHLVARDADHYVQVAVDLAADMNALATLRSGLRHRLLSSPLTDGDDCARALGSLFRSAWGEWCASD